MKGKNIVRYNRHNIPKGKTQWDKIKNMSEEEIESAAKTDHDNPRWTKKMLEAAKMSAPQKKVSVHMYMDQDIINWFKLDGKGYQTRINLVLKSYVKKHMKQSKG